VTYAIIIVISPSCRYKCICEMLMAHRHHYFYEVPRMLPPLPLPLVWCDDARGNGGKILFECICLRRGSVIAYGCGFYGILTICFDVGFGQHLDEPSGKVAARWRLDLRTRTRTGGSSFSFRWGHKCSHILYNWVLQRFYYHLEEYKLILLILHNLHIFGNGFLFVNKWYW